MAAFWCHVLLRASHCTGPHLTHDTWHSYYHWSLEAPHHKDGLNGASASPADSPSKRRNSSTEEKKGGLDGSNASPSDSPSQRRKSSTEEKKGEDADAEQLAEQNLETIRVFDVLTQVGNRWQLQHSHRSHSTLTSSQQLHICMTQSPPATTNIIGCPASKGVWTGTRWARWQQWGWDDSDGPRWLRGGFRARARAANCVNLKQQQWSHSQQPVGHHLPSERTWIQRTGKQERAEPSTQSFQSLQSFHVLASSPLPGTSWSISLRHCHNGQQQLLTTMNFTANSLTGLQSKQHMTRCFSRRLQWE